jgi:argininosuccinate lyase
MAGVPFRTAHEVVARAAQRAAGRASGEAASGAEDLEPGQDAPAIAELEAAAEEILGEPLTAYVDEETLAATLDPVESVAMRDSAGGPAPEAVEIQIDDAREGLATDEAAVAERRNAVTDALDALENEVSGYV